MSYYVKPTRPTLRGASCFRCVLRETYPEGPILDLPQPIYIVESSA